MKKPEEDISLSRAGRKAFGADDVFSLHHPFEDDPFYPLLASYTESVLEACLVKDDLPYRGYESHWRALLWACQKLFVGPDRRPIWRYDLGKAEGQPVDLDAFITAPSEIGVGKLNLRGAFLDPPYTSPYTEWDFRKLITALFPKGTKALEVYTWTTDWSEYFDDGHEWWGALCLSIYDRILDRFAVLLASSTD